MVSVISKNLGNRYVNLIMIFETIVQPNNNNNNDHDYNNDKFTIMIIIIPESQ